MFTLCFKTSGSIIGNQVATKVINNLKPEITVSKTVCLKLFIIVIVIIKEGKGKLRWQLGPQLSLIS